MPGFRSDYLTPSQKDDAFLATSFVSAKCISLRDKRDVTLNPSSLHSLLPRNSTSHCRNFSKQGARNLSLETVFFFDATGFRQKASSCQGCQLSRKNLRKAPPSSEETLSSPQSSAKTTTGSKANPQPVHPASKEVKEEPSFLRSKDHREYSIH